MDAMIAWITAHWQDVVGAIGGMVILARIIVKITPTQVDDVWLAKMLELLRHIALALPETTCTGPDDIKPPNRTNVPPAVLLLFLLPCLAGCATEARHDYTIEACNLVLANSDSMQALALDYSTGARAKALQDLKRLDDALMLQIEKIAKTTYTDDKARQAAILEAMTTYKTDVGAVEADKERVRDRDGRFRELVDATKEAAAGLLVVEARTWANKATATDIIDKAILGKVLSTMQTKGGGK